MVSIVPRLRCTSRCLNSVLNIIFINRWMVLSQCGFFIFKRIFWSGNPLSLFVNCSFARVLHKLKLCHHICPRNPTGCIFKSIIWVGEIYKNVFNCCSWRGIPANQKWVYSLLLLLHLLLCMIHRYDCAYPTLFAGGFLRWGNSGFSAELAAFCLRASPVRCALK